MKKILDEFGNNLDDEKDEAIKDTTKITFKLKDVLKIITVIIIILLIIIPITKSIFNNVIDEDTSEYSGYDEYIEETYLDDFDEEIGVSSEESFEEDKANISIVNSFIDINKKVNVILNNKNASKDIKDFFVYIIFYDGSDKPIGIDYQNINVLSSNTNYYLTFDETPKNYERYDFLITKNNFYDNYKSYKNDVTFETYEDDRDVIITGKNNGRNKIDNMLFFIVYYDDQGNVLKVDNEYVFDVKKDKKFEKSSTLGIYDEKTYEDIPYSRYEVVLGEAYSYDY